MTESERAALLQRPTKPVDVVLDTDTYNEIDDQFALAYMMKAPEKLNVLAITAAPFLNKKAASAGVGMELSYQEIEKLFGVLRRMKEEGHAIIIITHKLNEVMEISDRVAILRKGEYITTVDTAATNEQELTEWMVGRKIDLNIERAPMYKTRPLRHTLEALARFQNHAKRNRHIPIPFISCAILSPFRKS